MTTERLIDAIVDGDQKQVAELLRSGVDPNAALDEDLVTPLHFAAQYNQVEIAGLLLLAGADIDALTQPDQLSALDVARIQQHQEMINFLLTYYSNPARPKRPTSGDE